MNTQDSGKGHYVPSRRPHFVWVIEFPLFTRDDDDKDFVARGRWCSTHHPFTAPMVDDLEAFWNSQIKEVLSLLLQHSL